MADPLSSPPPQTGAPGAVGEDARIEHLLVTGLDHYFAGEFETAINLWTRVLFLDRNHDRARAYIERARSAQAERQRQTEALVHQGLDAFDRGDVDEARVLLRDALDRGAPHDLALGVLGRIDRLDVATAPRSGARHDAHLRRPASRGADPVRPGSVGNPVRFWLLTVMAVATTGMVGWWAWTSDTVPLVWPSPAAAPVVAFPESEDALPTPSAAETYLRRGEDLFASGRLRDALDELNRVPSGSPLRARADDMRARIQRELLALAGTEAPTPAPADAGPPRE
ncbi:MAG: tetratricopeptide repeat protein [Vicinamibacterales bacterium]